MVALTLVHSAVTPHPPVARNASQRQGNLLQDFSKILSLQSLHVAHSGTPLTFGRPGHRVRLVLA